MWNDLRVAGRLLAKNRLFTVAAVAALAVGMSASTAMFTLIHGVYLRDLPFSAPDRIVAVATRDAGRGPDALDNWSVPDLHDVQASARLFDGIVAADEESMDLADDERAPERYAGAWVSAGVFALLGREVALGRGFTAEDDTPGAAPVAILGDAVWTRRYGRDPDVIGRRVRVNGESATVVGVMPEGFGFPTQAQVWLPLSARPGEGRGDRGVRNVDVFARLADGVTIAQAEAELTGVMARLARQFPQTNAGIGAIIRPFRDLTTSGPIRTVFTALMAGAIFLLLVGCANVGNLLLAHGAARTREIAVRLALGATRWQVVRQLLAESLLLALAAGVAGLVCAAVIVRVFQAAVAESGPPYWVQVPMEWRVLAFVASITLGTAILCGLAPALHASRARLIDPLGAAARSAAAAGRLRWTDIFVVVQLALSLTMLAGAGMFMRHVSALTRVDVGVEMPGLVVAGVSLPARRYASDDDRRAFYRQFVERMAAFPWMRAGLTSAPPGGGAPRRRVSIDGRAPREDEAGEVASVGVSPGYLEALGLTALRGRLFSRVDDTAPAVAIVNERFAALHAPGEDAVGRTIRFVPGDPAAGVGRPMTIVGVVANVRQASVRQQSVTASTPEPVVYTTYAATPLPAASVMVRSGAPIATVTTALRGALGAIDPDLPLQSPVPFGEAIARELGLLLVFGSMFALLAATALGLATVGLYALTAYAVRQRTRELGVRIALGARPRHVRWVVARRVAGQLAIGVPLGVVGALGAGRLLQGAFMPGRDPLTIAAVSLLVVLVALAACAGPAARAIRVNAVTALRAE